MTVATAASYPFLVGDIGGTNVRFGVLDAPGAPLALLPRALTREHDSPIAALRAALDGSGAVRPRSALLAVAAGRRRDGAPDQRRLDRRRGGDRRCVRFRSVELVNDFVPVAAALSLGCKETEPVRIGPECPVCPGARLVVGPGTGFGAAALLPMGELCDPLDRGRPYRLRPAEPDEAALRRSSIASPAASQPRRCCREAGLLRLYRALGQSRSAAIRAGPRRRSLLRLLPATTRLRPRRCTCSCGSSAASPAISRDLRRRRGLSRWRHRAEDRHGAVRGRVPPRLRAQGAVRALDAGGADLPHRRSGPGADRPLRHPRRPQPASRSDRPAGDANQASRKAVYSSGG